MLLSLAFVLCYIMSDGMSDFEDVQMDVSMGLAGDGFAPSSPVCGHSWASACYIV
jgi:hypothetical protein